MTVHNCVEAMASERALEPSNGIASIDSWEYVALLSVLLDTLEDAGMQSIWNKPRRQCHIAAYVGSPQTKVTAHAQHPSGFREESLRVNQVFQHAIAETQVDAARVYRPSRRFEQPELVEEGVVRGAWIDVCSDNPADLSAQIAQIATEADWIVLVSSPPTPEVESHRRAGGKSVDATVEGNRAIDVCEAAKSAFRVVPLLKRDVSHVREFGSRPDPECRYERPPGILVATWTYRQNG